MTLQYYQVLSTYCCMTRGGLNPLRPKTARTLVTAGLTPPVGLPVGGFAGLPVSTVGLKKKKKNRQSLGCRSRSLRTPVLKNIHSGQNPLGKKPQVAGSKNRG
jgi:hypothetical protein